MSFVGEIFSQLKAAADITILEEIRDGQVVGVSGDALLELTRQARTFLAAKGLKKDDRCGVLAANSVRWIALDLAAMAEGLIVVPLYFRQSPTELVAMMKDSTPSLVCCGDSMLRDGIQQNWPGGDGLEAPPHFLFEEIFAGVEEIALGRPQLGDGDPVTIISVSYTHLAWPERPRLWPGGGNVFRRLFSLSAAQQSGAGKIWRAAVDFSPDDYMGRDFLLDDLHPRAYQFLRDAFPARRGRGWILPRHHPVYEALVPGQCAGSSGRLVHDRESPCGHHRKSGLRGIARVERQGALRMAVDVSDGGCSGHFSGRDRVLGADGQPTRSGLAEG